MSSGMRSIMQGRQDALLGAVLIGAGGFNLYDGLVQCSMRCCTCTFRT